MSEGVVIARPYAKAAFNQAVATNSINKWSDALSLLGTVTCDERVVALVKDPRVSDTEAVSFLVGVYEDKFEVDTQVSNFIKVLAENQRLLLLPQIAEVFELFRADHEKTVEVEVSSSFELSDTQKQSLTQALKTRFERDVSMSFAEDKSLLGGAVIRVGDYVIDGSIKGKLSRLSNYLNLKEKVCQ